MFILVTRNINGSFTFSGYIRRTYYGYTLTAAKRLYRQECKNTGYSGCVYFMEG